MLLAWLSGCRSPSQPPDPTRAAAASRYPQKTVPGAFVPPDAAQRRDAVGSLDGLRGPARRVFDEGEGMFDPVPPPQAGDWLDEHAEVFQTFDRYQARRTIHPDATRAAIYLVEIGEFTGEASPSVDALVRYVEAFYGMPVRRMPRIGVAQLQVDARSNDGLVQLHARQILEYLREHKPADAFALAAVTMYDLYPDESWNFVFGFANAEDQVGVFSFARFDPQALGQPRGPDFERRMLRRSVNTLAHELGHMFGISHCTHFHCVMNGHNHEQEGARLPMHLCPVDLRKLERSIGFDPIERYRRLQAVDRALGFEDEAAWIEARLAWVQG